MNNYTTVNANLNSQDYRLTHTPAPRTCDGLEYPCSKPGRYVVTLQGPNYDATPTYLTTTLCETCKATWESWKGAK